MSECHKCGTNLIEGQRICPTCGMDNSEAAKPRQPSAPEAAEKTQAATASPVRKSAAASNRGVSATTKAIIAAAVAILFAGALVVWQVRAGRSGAVSLSA